MPRPRGFCLAEQRRLVIGQAHHRLAAQQMALLELPVLDDAKRRADPRPGIQRTQHAQQRQEGRNHQGEARAPARIEVAHARNEGNHQERLRGEVGVGTVGEDAGFVLDLAAVEIQALLGRAEHPGIARVDLVFGGGRGDDAWHWRHP